MKNLAIIVLSVATLVGCGAVYRSSDVIPGRGDGAQVRVVSVNPETVLQANRSPFSPKRLPAIFSATAGSGGSLRGIGALPEPTTPAAAGSALNLRPPPEVNPGPYRIGVGDVVLLSTRQSGSTVEELSGLLAAQNARQGYTVQDDGAINVPNVGRVQIAGRTVEDAEAVLFDHLVKNQIDPAFSLEIAEFRSQRITVGGAVAAPTILPVTLTPVTLDAALSAAGGISAEDQDQASVRLYRDGSLYQIPVRDLYERPGLLKSRLVDGDAVFVDTDFNLDRAQAFFEQQITLSDARLRARQSALNELQTEIGLRRADLNEARSNFQARASLGEDQRDYVYIVGEVRTQSRFALPYGRRANLADALFGEARGLSVESGDVSQIYVLRGSPDPREFGAITAWHLDARNAAVFALAPRFELRPDDIIFVAQQPITQWNRAVSQLLPSVFGAARAVSE
jgi:polysaccharide export outer membrane protein